MSSFQEEVTKAIIDTMQENCILCANYHLMGEIRQEQLKDTLYMAVKHVMEINGYGYIEELYK